MNPKSSLCFKTFNLPLWSFLWEQQRRAIWRLAYFSFQSSLMKLSLREGVIKSLTNAETSFQSSLMKLSLRVPERYRSPRILLSFNLPLWSFLWEGDSQLSISIMDNTFQSSLMKLSLRDTQHIQKHSISRRSFNLPLWSFLWEW